MKPITQYLITGILAFACSSISAQPGSKPGTVEISLQPEFSGLPLVLGEQQYRSATGDSLYLDLLRFYLSSVELRGADAIFQEKNSNHLIDIAVNGTPVIVLKNVPAARYDSLYFLVGTDSLTNISGALGGDLDPTNGMYWAWNTGYINVKIEGRSSSCNTRKQAFEFHIGGYLPPHQTARKVVLPLKNGSVRAGEVTRIVVRLDLGKFFSRLDLAATNSMMIPSAKAALLADYFQQVFEIKL